jgi:hypothetical protein
MKGLSLFPVLSDKIFKRLGLTIPSRLKCFHIIDGETYEFEYNETGDSVSLVSAGWDAETSRLGIKASYKIQNPNMLFGKDGIACKDSVLGVAILWKSKDSRQRGSIQIGSIKYGEGPTSIELENYSFNAGQFRGKLTLETVIYLKESGIPKYDESILSNIPGTVYGGIDKIDVYFDGAGAICQTYVNPTAGGPLWKISCEFDDPLSDGFYESVVIETNPLNTGYKYIDPSNAAYNPEMLREILAEQMSTILLTIRMKCSEDEWTSIMDGNADKDSIGDITFSLMNEGIDLSSPTACAESMRRYIIGENLDR